MLGSGTSLGSGEIEQSKVPVSTELTGDRPCMLPGNMVRCTHSVVNRGQLMKVVCMWGSKRAILKREEAY